MRRYETIFILRPSLNEKEIDTVVDMVLGVIADTDGKIIDLNRWGMKKLAYTIKKETQGFYVFIDYSGTPAAVSEIERRFRIDDTVLRYMTVKTSEDISDEQIVAATDLASQKKIEAEKEETSEADDSDQNKSDSAE